MFKLSLHPQCSLQFTELKENYFQKYGGNSWPMPPPIQCFYVCSTERVYTSGERILFGHMTEATFHPIPTR